MAGGTYNSRISVVKMKKNLLLLLSFILIFQSGCITEEAENPPAKTLVADRTLLVYLAGDNNLWQYMDRNIAGIRAGMNSGEISGNTKVVVYYDTPYDVPRLTEFTPGRETLLKEYPEQNSASGAILREVVEDMSLLAPARHYGLVLGSHGTAWIPSSAIGQLTRTLDKNSGVWPETRFFGEDVSVSPAGYMNIDELAGAIPDRQFDYILFDACYMGSVEVVYALRDKTGYIISSPAEEVADGYPYERVLPALLAQTPDLVSVCNGFYEYYAGHDDPRYHSATVSLVRTAGLHRLWQVTDELSRTAMEAESDVFAGMDIGNIQHFDRYKHHFMFDLKETVDCLAEKNLINMEQRSRFESALAATVLYEAHTPYCFGEPIRVSCGLSGYIPVAGYAELNEHYNSMEWKCFASGPQ